MASSLFTLRRKDALKKAKISHVVSALRPPLEPELYREYKHYVVAIDDLEEENIVEHFPGCNEFIQEGLDGGGGVLVHCAMGKSRSVTLVTAYLLHHSHHNTNTTPQLTHNNDPLTPSTALSLIRETRPMAEPNPSFLAQLHLYHTISCPSTTADLDAQPLYQRWCWDQEVERARRRKVAPGVEGMKVGDELDASGRVMGWEESGSTEGELERGVKGLEMEGSEVGEGKGEAELGEGGGTMLFKCKRCRTHLASSPYLLPPHVPPTGSWKAKEGLVQSSPSATTSSCSHLWLEQPLSWMRKEMEEGKMDGRLECPNRKCRTQVGRYAWQGLKCSCGKWVVPGISLGKGKVDAVTERGGRGRDGVRGGIDVERALGEAIDGPEPAIVAAAGEGDDKR